MLLLCFRIFSALGLSWMSAKQTFECRKNPWMRHLRGIKDNERHCCFVNPITIINHNEEGKESIFASSVLWNAEETGEIDVKTAQPSPRNLFPSYERERISLADKANHLFMCVWNNKFPSFSDHFKRTMENKFEMTIMLSETSEKKTRNFNFYS